MILVSASALSCAYMLERGQIHNHKWRNQEVSDSAEDAPTGCLLWNAVHSSAHGEIGRKP